MRNLFVVITETITTTIKNDWNAKKIKSTDKHMKELDCVNTDGGNKE